MSSKNEEVTSRFSNTAGHRPRPPRVVNVSGIPSPNTMTQPRDRRGVAVSLDPPGFGTKRNRRPVQIDAVTGQELADQGNAVLGEAARHPETGAYTLTFNQLHRAFAPPSPYELHARRRAVHHEVASAAADNSALGGHLGGGLYLNSPAAMIRRIFGVKDR